MYKDFIQELEFETGIDTGYWESGIICPAFSEEESYLLKKRLDEYLSIGLTGEWLDRKDLEKIHPHLNINIKGGVLYDKDGQVDSRALMKALVKSVKNYNADIIEDCKVLGVEEKNGRFFRLKTEKGYIYGDFCIISAGAWSGNIIDIPVFPVKGEMIAIDNPDISLSKIFYSSYAYIIPRKNKTRVVVGATEEKVGFKEGNTVKGVKKLLNGLVQTFPDMENRNIIEIWFGFRPATPDFLPVLDESWIKNLYISTGHYRNGILLAPISAKLISELIEKKAGNIYTQKFSHKRFRR
jgi:glycine oxidase ThiO